jgi:hypothetical protein
MFKKIWNWLLSKTTIDETLIEVAQTVEVKVEKVQKEAVQAKKAIAEAVNQVEDVVEAVVKPAPKKAKKRYYAPKTKTTPKKPAAKPTKKSE